MDGRIIRDTTKIRNDQALIDQAFNPDGLGAERYDCVFDLSDLPTEGLVMQSGGQSVKSFKITPTLNSANAVSPNLVLLSQIYGGYKF